MSLSYKKRNFFNSATIFSIIAQNLCCGCGTCVGVCPTGALRIDIRTNHEPVIDESKCTSCGLCLAVCPGKGYPVVEWARKRCDKESEWYEEHGPVNRYLLGHSTDSDIRLNSASGGIATSLLLHLLESGYVDDVAVVGMQDGFPVAKLTRNPQEIRDALASKYGPVPIMASLIAELHKRPRRVAITCTPCQLAGWKLVEQKISKLQGCLVLAIGLFCGQIKTYESLTPIAATLGVRYPGGAKFHGWRCGPYPGSARFELQDGTIKEKPLYPWLDIAVPHYSLHRCFVCPDGSNWLADITLGDIHAGGDDETVVVCRTHKALKFLQSAQETGYIKVKGMTTAQVESCVIKQIVYSKMLPGLARIRWRKKHSLPVPEFDYDAEMLLSGKNGKMAFFWIWKYRLTFWVRAGWRRNFLLNHPNLMEKTGHFLYKFPSSIPGWKILVQLRNRLKNPINRANNG